MGKFVLNDNTTPISTEVASPKQHVESGYFENLEDAVIWDKFRAGDKSAFIFIYKSYFQSLRQYGYHFAGGIQLVEDAIQDLFIDLNRNHQRLSATNSIKFYLYKSLRRRLIYYLEKQKKTMRVARAAEDLTFKISLSVEQFIINRQIESERRKKLDQALKNLTAHQREAIYYFYYENMTYAEIKEFMDFKNINSARNLIYRAIDSLKSALI